MYQTIIILKLLDSISDKAFVFISVLVAFSLTYLKEYWSSYRKYKGLNAYINHYINALLDRINQQMDILKYNIPRYDNLLNETMIKNSELNISFVEFDINKLSQLKPDELISIYASIRVFKNSKYNESEALRIMNNQFTQLKTIELMANQYFNLTNADSSNEFNNMENEFIEFMKVLQDFISNNMPENPHVRNILNLVEERDELFIQENTNKHFINDKLGREILKYINQNGLEVAALARIEQLKMSCIKINAYFQRLVRCNTPLN